MGVTSLYGTRANDVVHIRINENTDLAYTPGRSYYRAGAIKEGSLEISGW